MLRGGGSGSVIVCVLTTRQQRVSPQLPISVLLSEEWMFMLKLERFESGLLLSSPTIVFTVDLTLYTAELKHKSFP